MKCSNLRTVQVIFGLLLAMVVIQVLYTALYLAKAYIPQQLLWGLEAFVCTILAAFAGAAMVQTKKYRLGWSAIAFAAVLNAIQVSIGVTLYEPFYVAASQVQALVPVADAFVALSFMIYNAAKLLLGFAALIFGAAKMMEGARELGGLTALVGVIAIFANAILVVFGHDIFLPSGVAGASGVLATFLLAFCLMSVICEDSPRSAQS